MTKQYLRKREYLGTKKNYYALIYGNKSVLIKMVWISGEYRIIWARIIKELGILLKFADFPYRRSVKTIDRIEELLR